MTVRPRGRDGRRGAAARRAVAVLALLAASAACAFLPVPPRAGEGDVPGADAAASPSAPAKVVLGYYAYWTRPRFDQAMIDFGGLTHLAHAFAWPDAAGNLVLPPRFLYPELLASARAAGVTTLLSLGGWGNCAAFPAMAAGAESRRRFVGQVVGFCAANGYDGVDLDWEFPADATDRENLTLLVRELAAALRARTPPLLLTMAAPARGFHGRWIDFERLAGDLDYVGFMTYGYHGAWSGHSGPNAPLYAAGGDACGSVDETFAYALARGLPPGKVLLGLPFFGKSFDCGGWGLPFRTSANLTYADIMALPAAEWETGWDDAARAPFLRRVDGAAVISYDDPRSIALKCRYAVDKGAGGVMVWELGGDRRAGSSELLAAVGRALAAR